MTGPILIWWLTSSCLGWLAFPLVRGIFSRLPDKGYGLSRAFGLLLSGYMLWMGTSLGILRNNPGGTLGAVILLGSISFIAGWREREELITWVRQNWKMILTVEVLFTIIFIFWSVVRSYDPAIQHTEQPMDMAFLNGILSSETFPPQDPWLAGYSISYYYFGYILLAFMTKLTGITASVSFNLGNALWFALSVVGAYSILLNLVSIGKERLSIFSPLLGPLFLVITGNLEVIFELLYYRQAFWRLPITGDSTSSFWTWLNLKSLKVPPVTTPSWIPSRHWWWWQASRVVYDEPITGSSIEMIDEFPFFSFLLADNHPHVLALPFVLIAISFALNVFRGGFDGRYRLWHIGEHIRINKLWMAIAGVVIIVSLVSGTMILITGGMQGEALQAVIRTLSLGAIIGTVFGFLLFTALGRFEVAIPGKEFWLGGWTFGALAFLNTWDFPFYLSLLFLVILWNQWRSGNWEFSKRFLTTVIALSFVGVLFYLPWYPTFSSQAGGILPNIIFPTRLVQFLIMFGPLIVPIFVWLVRKAFFEDRVEKKGTPVLVAVALPVGLFLLSLFLALVAYLVIRDDPSLSGVVFSHLGALSQSPADALREVISAALLRRLMGSWTTVILAFVIFMCMALVLQVKSKSASSKSGDDKTWIFVIFLVIIGTLLVLGPEFVYLEDQFGHRMNTIFKFYYAAWIMWALAAAYATISIWPKSFSGFTFLRTLVILPLLAGLLYPAIAIWTKTNHFSSATGPTLDGFAYVEGKSPGEYEAIKWIQNNLQGGRVAEAITIRSSYSYYGRVSTFTSLSALLGWPGHESQWRGGSEEQGSRLGDLEKLYSTRSWQEAKEIVDRYGIDYVYIGPLERSTYTPLDDRKFLVFMDPIFENSEVTILAVVEFGELP